MTAPRHEAGPAVPALLVSLHDVSPLTLGQSRRAWDLAIEAGVPADALTLLVIPRHEDRAPVDQHPPTRDWLRAVSDRGATLVMHGYTHRMAGRSWTPTGLFWAHAFARGQGELYRSDAADAGLRIEAGAEILRRAGLETALRGFVPPAWLLSESARRVVESASFGFRETFGGILGRTNGCWSKAPRAGRLVGWGSLSEVEARVSSLWAEIQAARAPADARFAIHPVDLDRPSSVRSIRRALARWLARARPLGYARYLDANAA